MSQKTLSINESRYRDYASKAVFGYALTRFGNFFSDCDYEDIISDVVYRMLKYRDSYDSSKSEFQTWVGTIARNTVNTWARHMKDRSSISGRILSDEDGQPLADVIGDLDADRDLSFNDCLERLFAATGNDYERELLSYKIEGFDTEEIAKATGQSVKQVYMRWFRLKNRLFPAA